MPATVADALTFPPVDSQLLEEVVRRIRLVGNPERIVLFGSHAHGTDRPDSDLDLLIVEDSDLPRYRRAPRYLRALLFEYRFSSREERRQGIWWRRELKGLYCPVVSLRQPPLTR